MMRKYCIPVLLLAFLISACCDDDPSANGVHILGNWDWIQSTGGFTGHTITPQTEGYTKSLRITNVTFSEYQGDSLIFESRYVYLKDTLFGEPEYIDFETGGALGVEFTEGKMKLIEFCSDCYIHEYVN